MLIRNLNTLVKKLSKTTCRYEKENVLSFYCGDDWKEHIQYGKRFELLLLNHPTLFLIGLKSGERLYFKKSTLIKVLPDDVYDYVYRQEEKTENTDVYTNIIEMCEGSYLVSEKQINFLSLIL